jgi:hypothetical protein
VICDVNLFLDRFKEIGGYDKAYDISAFNVKTQRWIDWKTDDADNIKQAIRQSLIIWVLGHEIGHAVLHKNIVLTNKTPLHFDLEYNKYEIQADSFVADQLSKSPAVASEFANTTGEFIQHEYRKLYGQTRAKQSVPGADTEEKDFPINFKILVNYSRYNVPLLLRSARIITSLLNQAPDIDNTGYYQSVASNISVGKPISTNMFLFWTVLFGAVLTAVLIVAVLNKTKKG